MGCSTSSTVDTGASFHLSYQLGRELGEGAFGQVRAAKSKKDGSTDLAVKIIDARGRDPRGHPTSHTDKARVAMARQEIKMWHLVGSCDNCVSLESSYFERNLFFLVMPKCDTSLMDKLSSSALPEGDVCRIFSEMLAGIRHLHARKIVHRDIKPDNYLLGGDSGTTVKLCDFGMAAQLPKQGVLKGVSGTAPYMSPEMLSARGYCLKTDVWSFGASAFFMIHGDFPYVPLEPSVRSMKQTICRGLPSIRFTREVHDEATFSRGFVDRATPFLKALLQREPHTRKTAEDALQLHFLHSDLARDTAITLQSDAPVLVPVARKARRASKQEHELSRASRRQSIQQTYLEDLLGMLQEKHGALSEVSTTYFSEGDDVITDPSGSRRMDEGRFDDRIVRRSKTRLRTISSVVDKRPESVSASTWKASDLAGLTDPQNQNCDDACPRGFDLAKMAESCPGTSTSTSVYVQL